jgi:hypothetical protein
MSRSSCLRVTINTERAAAAKANDPVSRDKAVPFALVKCVTQTIATRCRSASASSRRTNARTCGTLIRVESPPVSRTQAGIDGVNDHDPRFAQCGKRLIQRRHIDDQTKWPLAELINNAFDNMHPVEISSSGFEPRPDGTRSAVFCRDVNKHRRGERCRRQMANRRRSIPSRQYTPRSAISRAQGRPR